jgi:hypothetical protein
MINMRPRKKATVCNSYHYASICKIRRNTATLYSVSFSRADGMTDSVQDFTDICDALAAIKEWLDWGG